MQPSVERLEQFLAVGRAMNEALDGPEQPFGIEPEDGLISQFLPPRWKRRLARRWKVVHREPIDNLTRRGDTVHGPVGRYEGLLRWQAAETCALLIDGFRVGRRHLYFELNPSPHGP